MLIFPATFLTSNCSVTPGDKDWAWNAATLPPSPPALGTTPGESPPPPPSSQCCLLGNQECACAGNVLSHLRSCDHRNGAFLQGAFTPPGFHHKYCSFQTFLGRRLPQHIMPRFIPDLNPPMFSFKKLTLEEQMDQHLIFAWHSPTQPTGRITSVEALTKCHLAKGRPLLRMFHPLHQQENTCDTCLQLHTCSCLSLQVSDFFYHTLSPGNFKANEAARCGAWVNICTCVCTWRGGT